MPDPKLKPCPFCGGPAVYRNGSHPWEAPQWSAGCIEGHATSTDMGTKDEAAEWWNRRAPARKEQS